MNTLDLLQSALLIYVKLEGCQECHLNNLHFLIIHLRTHANLNPLRKKFDCTHCMCHVPKDVIESASLILSETNLNWTNTSFMLQQCATDKEKLLRFTID